MKKSEDENNLSEMCRYSGSKPSEYELTPQEKYAKILIKIQSQDNLEKAIQIINNEGGQILCLKYITADNVILELNVEDMRTIVLRLVENGFTNIKAINAIEPCASEQK